MGARDIFRHVWGWRSFIIIFLTPYLLLPIPMIIGNSESKCAYVVLLMAVYWISEAMPVAVTSLIPVLLFPLLGIADSATTVEKYMNDVNMLFICGLVMAVAIEYWNLHRRIALGILLLVGSEPRWLMLGLMVATWFLSMWISNTASTAMMVPIADAVLVQLKATRVKVTTDRSATNGHHNDNGKSHKSENSNIGPGDVALTVMPPSEKDDDVDKQISQSDEIEEPEDPIYILMCKGMSLCICYAANAGGIASLTGTGPNLVLKGQADQVYERVGLKNPVNFGSWMGFGLPLSFIVLAVCWIWLNMFYLRCRGGCGCCSKGQSEDQKQRVKAVIREEYRKLGPIVFGQAMVMVLFLVLVTLWITRDMGGVAGWGELFPAGVKDSLPAVFVAILLFALPSTLPFLRSYSDPAHPEKDLAIASKEQTNIYRGPVVIRPLLNWKIVHEKMPWSLFLLLGGGFALSHGCKVSGLSEWIGTQLAVFSDWNQWVMLLIICYITAMATEVTSNTAISQLFLPIMAQLAIDTQTHPLYYMFPVALACSFAFMLPVATPPNAIVFAYGRVHILDMVKAGSVMNVIAVPILVVITGTVGDAIFDFNNIPIEFLNETLRDAGNVISTV